MPTSKRVHFEGGNLAGSALASASSSAHSKSSLSMRKRRGRRGREMKSKRAAEEELKMTSWRSVMGPARLLVLAASATAQLTK